MADVFISYSRKDGEFAGRLFEALRDTGRDIWIDWEDIPASAQWWAEICAGIEAADTFVTIVSANFLESPVCTLEVQHAIENGKRVLPVIWRMCDHKSALDVLAALPIDDNLNMMLAGRDLCEISRANWNLISVHNWVSFEDEAAFDASFNSLIKAVETDLDHVRGHTRWLVRAKEWERKAQNPSFLLQGDEINEAEAWLEQAAHKSPQPADLHHQYIAQSRRAEEERQRRLRQLRQATMGLGIVGAVAVLMTIGSLLQLTSANAQVEQANATLTQIPVTVTIAEGQAALAETQAAGAETLVADANSQVAVARLTATTGAQQLSVAQRQLDVAEDTLTPIPPTLTAAAAAVTQAQAELAGAERQVATSQQEATSAQAQIAAYGSTLTPIFSTLEAGNLAVTAARRDFGTAQAQVALANALAAGAETQIAEAQVQVTAAQQELGMARATLTPIPPTLTAAYELVQAGNLAVTQAQHSADMAYTEAANADIQVTAAREALAAVQTTLSPMPGTLTPIPPTLTAAYELVQAGNLAVTQAQQNAAMASTQAANAEMQVTAVQQALINAQATLTPVPATLDAAATVVAASNLQVTEAEIAITEAQAQVVAAQSTLVPIQGTAVAASAQAASVSLVSNAEAVLNSGNYDLGLALVLEALDIDPGLTQAQRLLNQIVYSGARFSFPAARAAEISPQAGAELLAVGEGREVVLYDLATRSEVGRLRGHDGDINDLEFHPDGSLLASAGMDGLVMLWDINTRDVHARLEGHRGAVNALAFNRDGSRLLSGGEDNTSIVWDVAAGALLSSHTVGNPWPVIRVRFASNEQNFYAWEARGSTQAMSIWRIGTNPPRTFDQPRQLFQVFDERPQSFYALAALTDNIVVVNTNTLAEERTWSGQIGFNWGADRVTAAAFNPAAAELLVALGGGDNRLVRLDFSSREVLRRFQGPGAERVSALAVSPDGRLALSGYDSQLILWDMASGTEIRRLTAHDDLVQTLRFSPDGRYAISIARNGDIRVWDVDSGDPAQRQQIMTRAIVTGISTLGYSPDGEVIYANVEGSLFEWSSRTGERLEDANNFSQRGARADVVFSPGHPYALTITQSGPLLWDMTRPVGQALLRQGVGAEGSTLSGVAAFSPDGQYLLLDGSNLLLVQHRDNQRVQDFDKRALALAGDEVIRDAVISADNRYVVLVTGLRDAGDEAPPGQVIVLSVESGEELRRFPVRHTRAIHSVAISPDSRTALTASEDDTLILWDIETGEVLRRLYGHRDDVNTVLFMPDGQQALSASDDFSIILWDLDSGQIIRRFTGHTHPVRYLAVRPDGREFASSTGVEEDPLRVWRIETPAEVHRWTLNNRHWRALSLAERDQYGLHISAVVTATPALPSVTPVPTTAPTLTATLRATSTPVANDPACAGFRMTSPLDSLDPAETTFTWTQLPGAATYWLVIYTPGGQQRPFPLGDVAQATVNTSAAALFAGETTLVWEVQAFDADYHLLCSTPRIEGARG